MNKITAQVALEIAHHEAIIRQAYKDSVGIWTWSVGLTSMSGHNVKRYIDKPQTLEKCLSVYVWALEEYAADVREAFEGRDLTEAQFAAALSFHWNTGAVSRAAWVKHFMAGDAERSRNAFMNFSKPASIIPRRKAERDLFFDGVWSNRGKITEFTRVTGSHAPDWGSAVKVDARQALERLLSGDTAQPSDKPPAGGVWAAIAAMLKAWRGK